MPLTVTYVAGVTPAKWLRIWAERRPDMPLEASRVDERAQLGAVRAGKADLAFVRLPIDTDRLLVVPLWHEVAVAVLGREHPYADFDELELALLADEPRAPEQHSAASTIELVGSGAGIAIVPHSLARLYARRDVVAIPVIDAEPTRIALVWPVDRDDDDIQEFVGVVRGRTVHSSRGAADARESDTAAPASPGRTDRGGRKHGEANGSKATRSRGRRSQQQRKRRRR